MSLILSYLAGFCLALVLGFGVGCVIEWLEGL